MTHSEAVTYLAGLPVPEFVQVFDEVGSTIVNPDHTTVIGYLRSIGIVELMTILDDVQDYTGGYTRDYFKYPFSSDSFWNLSLGSLANYAALPTNIIVSPWYWWIGGYYPVAMYEAKDTDLQGNLFFRSDMWSRLNSNLMPDGVTPVYSHGNTSAVENALRNGGAYGYSSAAAIAPLWRGNNYVTNNPLNDTQMAWPASPPFHDCTQDYYSRTFRIPSGAHPPDGGDHGEAESHTCILQPNGWWLNAFATVVCANGDIICQVASYIDTHGLGDGWTNGRRAPSIMSGAGIIRQGEFTSGVIRHKVCCNIGREGLHRQAVYPAVTWDTNPNYLGDFPMGATLALLPSFDPNRSDLSAKGKILAKCLQDYGLVLVDRGGPTGVMLYCEMDATDTGGVTDSDWNIIKPSMRYINNITEANPTGGGTERQPRLPV